MKLTKNFYVEEFEHSETAKKHGIENFVPDFETCEKLFNLCFNIMQPVRDKFGHVRISSGVRTKKLNSYIGGSLTSQHMTGEACDFVMEYMKSAFLFIKNNLDFDQLIWECGDSSQPVWIHVSYVSKSKNRKQVLKYTKKYGYEPFK